MVNSQSKLPRETKAKVLFKKNENDMNIFNSYPYLV